MKDMNNPMFMPYNDMFPYQYPYMSNDLENRVNNLERIVKKLENRISKLENTPDIYNQNFYPNAINM